MGTIFLLYSLCAYLRLRFQVREAVKIPGGWECEGIKTAFILGYFRPRIYIPMGVSLSCQSYILAHERAHLEKGDHWLKLLGYLALAIHWYNPLVWAAYILFCKDIELACDERVVRFMDLEERKQYSAALLRCSAERPHFAACPVAFGEVSVKQRIKSVLNYRKPGFWINLASIIAIVFVAVCLMTSPKAQGSGPAVKGPEPTVQENEPTVAVTEPSAAASEPEAEGFASNLSEGEIIDACEKAMEELFSRETYCVHADIRIKSTNDHYFSGRQGYLFRRAGDSVLTLCYLNEGNDIFTGALTTPEVNASFSGGAWVEDSYARGAPEEMLSRYSPAGKTVTFPEGTGILSGDSVSYAAQWYDERNQQDYSGTITYTFHKDGTLASILAEFGGPVDEDLGGGEVRYTTTVTVTEETAAETYQQIQSCAQNTITRAEYADWQSTMRYEQEYMYSSAQMGWMFLDRNWFFKFGAENVTETGLRLAVEVSSPYENSSLSSATVSSGGSYFLEKLKNGIWTPVPAKAEGTLPEKVLGPGSSLQVDWTDTYGALPPGFYRLGSSYTAKTGDGQTDTRVCYAKFRMQDPESDALLLQCRQGIENLTASDSYHVLVTHWLSADQDRPDGHYYTTEVWRSGRDYLEERLYYYNKDGTLKSAMGGMRRDGVNYDLTWAGSSCRNRVTDWTVNTYMEEEPSLVWPISFMLYDREACEFTQNGNEILVVDHDHYSADFAYQEMTFTFDGSGRLIGSVRTYVMPDGKRVVEEALEVLDTSEEEIRQFLDGQDVSTPAFSWEAEKNAYPQESGNVRTDHFRNTSHVTIRTPLDAINRALRDCTLPADGDVNPGTNMYHAFYDGDAKMWKVEFTLSWDKSKYQAVYLTDQGVTVMTVTLEREVNY